MKIHFTFVLWLKPPRHAGSAFARPMNAMSSSSSGEAHAARAGPTPSRSELEPCEHIDRHGVRGGPSDIERERGTALVSVASRF